MATRRDDSLKSRVGEALITLLLDVQRALVFVLFKLCYNLRVRGTRNLPRSGPYLVAPNHQARYDGFTVGFRVPPPVYCAVDKAYFKMPFVGWWLRTFRAIPMAEVRDVEGYRRSLEILQSGKRLIIVPEGFPHSQQWHHLSRRFDCARRFSRPYGSGACRIRRGLGVLLAYR